VGQAHTPPVDGNTPKDQPAARRRRVHVPTIAALTSDLRMLLLNVALLVVFLLIVPVVAMQFLHSQVIIQPFPVPLALSSRGLTPDVAANRLWDGLHDEVALANTSKEAIAAMPTSQRVDFAIPDSGVSIDSLVYYVRHFFHAYQTRISGEFRCADATCAPEGVSLRIRVMRDGLDIIQMPPIGTQTEADYFRAAAARVLELLDPFTAAAALATTDPDAALVEAERMVRMHHPDAIWSANLIGNIKLRQGDKAGAVAAYRMALQLKPDFVVAATNLGVALIAAGQLDEAGKVFAGLETFDANDKYLVLARFKLAQARGDLDGAIGLLMQAETLDPGTAKYYFLAGEAEFGAGHLAKAADYASRALDVAPADYAAVMLMSSVDATQSSFGKAEVVMARAVKADPTVADFQGQLAQMLHVLHRYPEALTAVEAALDLAHDSTAWQATRADILLSLHRAEDARAQATVITGKEPANAEAWLIEGQALAELNRTVEARAAYRTAINLDTGGYAAAAKGYLAVLDQSAKIAPPG
jgi:tetratricopeptide (TPR) repeat protein